MQSHPDDTDTSPKTTIATRIDHQPAYAAALFDQHLRCVACGGALLDHLGPGRDELIGEPLPDHAPTGVDIDVDSWFHNTLAGEAGSREIEYQEQHYLARTVPVWGRDEAVEAGLVLVSDVTARKRYERELNEARERVEELTSVVSHDLHEPLRAVTNYLQLLERRYRDELDDDAEEFLMFALEGAIRMRGMIDLFAADETGPDSEETPSEPVDLDQVLEGVGADLARKIEEQSARIETDALPRVAGDPDQLHQLLLNLLDNAIKYSGPDPPHVSISAEENGAFHTVSMTDRGIGIDEDNTDAIFELFNRGQGREICSGSGIGLAQCQRIVDRHGGDIWVDAERGEGTTFSFTLPAADGVGEKG